MVTRTRKFFGTQNGILALSILSLCLALYGCGGDDDSENGDQPQNTAQPQQPQTPPGFNPNDPNDPCNPSNPNYDASKCGFGSGGQPGFGNPYGTGPYGHGPHGYGPGQGWYTGAWGAQWPYGWGTIYGKSYFQAGNFSFIDGYGNWVIFVNGKKYIYPSNQCQWHSSNIYQWNGMGVYFYGSLGW